RLLSRPRAYTGGADARPMRTGRRAGPSTPLLLGLAPHEVGLCRQGGDVVDEADGAVHERDPLGLSETRALGAERVRLHARADARLHLLFESEQLRQLPLSGEGERPGHLTARVDGEPSLVCPVTTDLVEVLEAEANGVEHAVAVLTAAHGVDLLVALPRRHLTHLGLGEERHVRRHLGRRPTQEV